MKVSILVTTYNVEKYVDDAIKSVVSQEMPFDWELLVGDDGSTDQTQAIVKKWIDKYPENIKLFVNKRDETGKVGSRAARNRARLLEQACGEYINYLDGDDCFLGNSKIKTQVSILENPLNADCSCTAHNHVDYFMETGEKKAFLEPGIGDSKYDIFEYWPKRYYHTNTILFRKNCKDLLLRPLYRDFLNDNFITFLLLQHGKVYYSDNLWAQYNRTGDGLWTGHSMAYGDFRNMQLYDLEHKVRQDMNGIIMSRHWGSIRRIKKEYKHGMEEEIKPLLEGLDPKVFPYTFLLAKLGGLSIGMRIKKAMLFAKADLWYLKIRARALVKRIIR